MGLLGWAINNSFALMADYYSKQFDKDTKRAGTVNREILREILQANAQTEYGRLYDFAGIKDSGDYRAKVPLTAYADYEPYIERMAQGEENLLTADPVKYFGLSSGTTGKQKYIPTTARTTRIINMNMMFLQQGLLARALPQARNCGKGLLLMNMVQAGRTETGIPTGSATSGGANAMKKMFPYFWSSPVEVLQLADQQVANYLHLLFALRERNLAYLGAPFPSSLAQLFAVLEENWPQILQDLAKGQISAALPLDAPLRTELASKLKPLPQRAKELERELAKGLKGIAPRIWPQMVYVSCVIGGSFNIYLEKLRYYTGDLPIYSAVYGATEALVGIGTKVDDITYVVTPRPAFYEFMPLEQGELDQPTTLELDEVKVGASYEVVITNFAGFYRYRLGDVVKVVGRYHETPVIEFMYRKGQLLNVAGEKTAEPAVRHAVKAAMERYGALVEDYTVVVDLDGPVGRYRFYLESSEHERLLKQQEQVRESLEQCLGEANPRYQANLTGKRIAPLRLHIVGPGTFQELRQELVKRGASLNQVKIPRVVKDGELIAVLEKNVLR